MERGWSTCVHSQHLTEAQSEFELSLLMVFSETLLAGSPPEDAACFPVCPEAATDTRE